MRFGWRGPLVGGGVCEVRYVRWCMRGGICKVRFT